MNDTALGVSLCLIMVYLFIGIAVVSDILMDAIRKITSATRLVEVKEADSNKTMMIDVPVWNSRLVNLSLLAIGSALPEICLCFMSTFSEAGKGVPTELGPMALVGSSAFNLLIVAGLSIASVSELKKIANYNSFLVSFAFATFACVWLFLVLMVITPGWISFSEAAITLMFYPLLLTFGWITEKCSSQDELSFADELEVNRRRMCKSSLMSIRDAKGAAYVIDMATGASDPAANADEVKRIQEYYKVYLGLEDLS